MEAPARPCRVSHPRHDPSPSSRSGVRVSRSSECVYRLRRQSHPSQSSESVGGVSRLSGIACLLSAAPGSTCSREAHFMQPRETSRAAAQPGGPSAGYEVHARPKPCARRVGDVDMVCLASRYARHGLSRACRVCAPPAWVCAPPAGRSSRCRGAVATIPARLSGNRLNQIRRRQELAVLEQANATGWANPSSPPPRIPPRVRLSVPWSAAQPHAAPQRHPA